MNKFVQASIETDKKAMSSTTDGDKSVTNYSDNIVFGPMPSDDDYKLIKKYMMSDDINKEDVFVYKVVLCDNKIDRDGECFTVKALEKIAELYNGKVGIQDHDPLSKNVHSRIYKTELKVDKELKNDFGEPYTYVLGYAYTISNDKTKQLIDEIKSGLKKEVSVGVSDTDRICSICGRKLGEDGCNHKINETYNGKICCGLLDDINDVYEWSFVAVPSQKNAGVTKSKKLNIAKKEAKLMTLKTAALKIIKNANITPEDAQELLDEIDKVEKPNEAMKALEEENNMLKGKLEKALKELEENKTKKTEEYVVKLIEEMNPVNDTMKEIARRVVEQFVETDENGELTEDSEKTIKEELTKEEYKPLFKGYEEDTHAIDEAAALEEEREEVINRLESGECSGFGKSKKTNKSYNLDFSRNSRTKQTNKSYQQRTGVMGIHFRDRD